MRTSTRLLILFLAISFAFLAYFYLFFHFKQAESRLFLDYDQVQRRQSIDAIIEVKKSSEFNVLRDYRSRADLIDFVWYRDKNWAETNLNKVLDSYGLSIVQIYDTRQDLIYSAIDPTLASLSNFRLEPAMLDSLSTAKTMDFSQRFGANLLSLSAASIHRAADSLSTDDQAYMLVGSVWDNRFFGDIARSLSYSLNISYDKPKEETPESTAHISLVYPITDWNSKPVMWLSFYVVNSAMDDLRLLGRQVIFATGGFILLFLLIQFVLIEQWISIPLGIISKSLKDNRLDLLSRIKGGKNEFADVAHLIEKFFEQRQSLRREIETRERTQEKLREIEEQTLTIFLTSPESIILTDLDGKLITANDETYQLLGMEHAPKNQFLPLSLSDYVECKGSDTLDMMLSELIEGELVRNREVLIRRPDGASFPALISASVVYDAEQKPTRLIFITRDLTEIKHLEQQLLQAQKMESLGTLAGGIAHDFNNIMTIIAGYIAVSAAKITGNTDAQDDLDEALKACLRAKNLISKILTFTRSTKQQVQSISLADVLTDSLPMIRASLPSIISIETQISSHELCMADPTEIQQILINLSSNAFYAMRKSGGKLIFSIKELSGFELIGLDPEIKINQDYLQLNVTDTGSGIPHEVLGRIFDPYFSTRDTGEGTGLGLSIVHGIVKNCSGFISVHSVVDEGTTFSIYLPIVEKQSVPQISPPLHSALFVPARILFVDDEVALTELFSISLEEAGYKVKFSSDPQEALDLFKADPDAFDLIIADVTMPVMDGIKLAGLIRETSDIPIILYSGYSAYNLAAEVDELAINRVLSKPILPADMIREIKDVLAEKKGASA